MSISGIPDHDHRLYKKSNHHRRNDSDELDVFEAARYFSGGTTAELSSHGFKNGAILSHHQKSMNIIKDERQAWGGRRISLDMPAVIMRSNQLLPSQTNHRIEKQIKEKKFKQPSSPGGKLASFLNSLFNQSTSKMKKSSSNKITSSQTSMKDDIHQEEISHGMRRKRRSSISNFQSFSNSTNSSTDIHTKSSSLSAGFRTPPPYTLKKSNCKDFRSDHDSDHHDHQNHRQQVNGSINLSKNSGRVSSISLQDEKINREMDFSWLELDEKFKFIDGFSSENKNNYKDFFSSPGKKDERIRVDEDGGESDSSSDLFELQNYELGSVYSSSSGLPVYETTHIDQSIKRGSAVPISNGSL